MVPLFWPACALIAGILLSPCLDIRSALLCLPLTVLLCIPRLSRRTCSLLAIVIVGAGLRAAEPVVPPLVLGNVASRVSGTLTQAPEWHGPGVYLDLEVQTVDTKTIHGKARLTEFLEQDDLRQMFDDLKLGSGDQVEILVKLRRPASYGDPGVFDYRHYLEQQDVYWTGTIRNPRLITVMHRGWHGADRLRNGLQRRLDAPVAGDPNLQGLLSAMVLGRRDGVAPRTEHQFQAGGIYHLLVVSGIQLGMLGAIGFWLLRRIPGIPLRRTGQLLLIGAGALLYALLAGGQTSLMRAATMMVWGVAGRILDRGHALGNTIAGSLMVLLLYRPSQIEDSGFQMTFAAVVAVAALGIPAMDWAIGWIGVALTAFKDSRRDARLPIWLSDWRVSRRLWCEYHGLPLWCVTLPWRFIQIAAQAVILSLSIEAGLCYFMTESFHRISPVGILLSIPAGLLSAVILPAGLILLVSPPGLTSLMTAVVTAGLNQFLKLVHFGLTLPFATVRVPSPPSWLWLAYFAALGALVAAFRQRRFGFLLPALGSALLLQGTIMVADFSPLAPDHTTVTFIDVGQGDSSLIEFPDGKRMLIDGGGIAAGRFLDLREESTFSIGENVVSPYLFSRGIRRLDVIALTHAHIDHLEGLLDVVENFKVGEVWLGRNPMGPAYRQLLEEIQQHQIPIRWLYRDDVAGPFTVLHPPRTWQPKKNDANNDSLVLLLRAEGATALFTGDIETRIPAPERVDLLKVSHHGSGGVRLHVDAPVRVISVGADNPFGHPHPSTLPALRTDKLGAITVTLADGSARVTGTNLTNPCISCKLPLLFNRH